MKSRALFTLLCGSFLRAEELPLDVHGWHDPRPVPAHARLSLEVPARVILGQRMPAALVVENTGTEEFEIATGGDYRCTGYPQRMKVRVRDADGHALPELTHANYGFGGGGLGGPRPVHPGTKEKVEFPLDCYVSFPKAGEYTVFAGHDLGWVVGTGFPITSAKIMVVEPTPAEAVEWIAESLPIPKMDGKEAEKYEWEQEHCAGVMRHPVYLPGLIKRAQEGSVPAVNGIGHIATPEATEALLALASHNQVTVAKTALNQLGRRLPTLEKEQGGWRVWSRYQIDPLLPVSWEERFDKPLIDVAVRSLSSSEKDIVAAGADFIQQRGTDAAAEKLLSALQLALDVYHSPRSGIEVNTLDFPPPQRALILALDALRARGWRSPQPGRTAQMVTWFRQLADDKVTKPPGDQWRTCMHTWVENGGATVQICALQALPQPLSDEAARIVRNALDDRDWGVVRVACEVAGKSKRPEFVTPLVQIIETMRENFLQYAAIDAAKSCGARLRLLQALAANIVYPERLTDSVRELVQATMELPLGSGSSGSSRIDREQRFAIRDAWQAFLKQNAKAFESGRKIAPPAAAVAAALTGATFDPESPVVRFDLKDGTRWPPKP